MMTFGVLPQHLEFTAGLALLKPIRLRRGCKRQGARFLCEYKNHKGTKYLGLWDTPEECNDTWDKHHEKEMAEKKPLVRKRRPIGNGYTIVNLESGIFYRAQITCSERKFNQNYVLGDFKRESDARAIYVEAIEHINSGDFFEWLETI